MGAFSYTYACTHRSTSLCIPQRRVADTDRECKRHVAARVPDLTSPPRLAPAPNRNPTDPDNRQSSGNGQYLPDGAQQLNSQVQTEG